MSWEIVEMRSFLSERKGRFKPNDECIKGLKRIEKIDFSGNIVLSDKPSKTDMILIKTGDLVISGINVEKGAMAIYQGKKNVVATIHYSSYEFSPDKIDVEFLRHFLKSSEFTDALKEQVPGGIKTEIKPKHILPLKVCIPINIEEQQEVVKLLDEQNETIRFQATELTHQLNLVKQLRQAFLREAMQGKLVPQDPRDEPASVLLAKIKTEKVQLVKEGKIKKQKPLSTISEDEIPYEIPESWVWCRLGAIALQSESGKSFQCENVKVKDEEWGVVKVSAVSWGDFQEDQNKLYSKHKPEDISAKIKEGDFLISRANTSELVGKSVVVKNISRNLLLSDKIIRFTFSNSVSADFLNFWNNSAFPRDYFARKGTGSSPSMKNITRVHMNEVLVPLPSLLEQQRIIAKLDELMQYCDDLEASIKESQQQNEQLLQQVLREALEPKEMEVERG